MESTVSTALPTTVIIVNNHWLTQPNHPISMVKINSYKMCVLTNAILLVSCTDDATLNSLARYKGFAVQGVPGDGQCHLKRKASG